MWTGMKFFHLSDLHIGKQLHRYNLKEDQQVILKEVIAYAKELRPDAIVIAGDIYDKSVPSAEAVTIFDEFLTDLSEITPEIPILIISGNLALRNRLFRAVSVLLLRNLDLRRRGRTRRTGSAGSGDSFDFICFLYFVRNNPILRIWFFHIVICIMPDDSITVLQILFLYAQCWMRTI